MNFYVLNICIIEFFLLTLHPICGTSLKASGKMQPDGDMRTEMAAQLDNNRFIELKPTAMSKICEITGKKASVGNNVSHSKRRTKRKFNVNLHRKKFFWVEQDMWIELLVSAHALRTINKIGLNAALKRAEAEGNIDFRNITILSL